MQCTPESADDLERYFYTTDEQGSTTLITDGAQDIKNEYFYDAFGNVLDSREEVHNRITYVGQQFDGITQQYYLRARFYNPVIGRFTQEDVYRGDGLNLYTYCRDNPVMYYDPSGYKLCAENKDRLFEEYKGYRDKGCTPQQAYEEMKKARNVQKASDNVKVAKEGAKTGPKPFGTGPHNKKITEVADSVKDGTVISGGGRSKEAVIPTPNRKKTKRRPDILVQKPEGSLYGINVGKTTKNGAPIKREVEAIYDLEDIGIPMYYVPYDK